DRRWLAPRGSSLLVSLFLKPTDPFAYQARRITMICGLALLDAIHQHTPVPARLKWPNDVMVDRPVGWGKLAGMLSEVHVVDGQPAGLVVGTGLNVNIPPTVLRHLAPNAASLGGEGWVEVDRVRLLDTYLASVERRVDALREGEDPLPAWRSQLAWIDMPVKVVTPNDVTAGVFEDVDAEGALLVRLPDGTHQRFEVGDVSLRLIDESRG
ncbi:MAG: biotin--[acetyl-CoA-carboxylase] ligase, partial [Anaerolineae bacterium]|nr:biotin--[acetyl-CoA-carboxylase] ligase [Anaerolineae bacterium]